MPETATEIKGLATEAGRRLLAILGGTDDADYQSPTTNAILAIEAEAAAAERAAIRAALNDESGNCCLADEVRFHRLLYAREPRP